ncbi:Metaxin-1 [Dactylella cylindrospora]|nr:Metaxin-1 [Dactylella cylindrospora]
MPPLELHIWSRGFGLPSINAECLSAVAYMSVAIPRNLWVIVESNNVGLSPTGSLPALKDGTTWIGGFDNIISYVNAKSSGQSDIDKSLSDAQKAQVTAYRSFIRSQARPLTSLSIYLTPKNYILATRPLYSTFIPFPIQYHIPSLHHARAVDLTSHLSSIIKELSIDEDKDAKTPVGTSFAGITTTSTSKEKTKAKKEKISTRVKLRNLLADFIDPISQTLNGKPYFFPTTSPTTIDCLLVGYLSLLIHPELPNPWSREIFQSEFKDVVNYVDNLRSLVFPENLVRKDPDEEDKLSLRRWIAESVESIPARYFSEPIPLEAGEKSSIAWGAVKALAGVATAAGAVFAYTRLVRRDVEVDVQVDDEVAKPVYAVARAEVGGADTGGDGVEEGRVEPLPIFRAEDMLGLRL